MSHIPDTAHMGHRDDNPQRDVPCVDCEREMSRRALDTRGRCADCRTPGGLLVTALRACGVAAERLPKRDGVRVAGMHIDADEVGWHILHNEFADDGRRTRWQVASEMRAQVADVVAAIVQAPARAAQIEQQAESIEILRRSLGLANDLHAAACEALTTAGHPRVPGRTLAQRVADLAAERDALAARVAELDRRTLHPLPDEPPAADLASLAAASRALVAQLRAVEEHGARMAARLRMIADACDVMATPAATRHTLAEALPRAHADDWRDTAAALRALAGGAA